jgi:signal transduction histidine kinase
MSAAARPSLSTLLGRKLGWALGALGLALAFAVHFSVLALLERGERDKAQALARQLTELSVDPLLVRDYGVLERAAGALAGHFDVVAIEIERGDGVTIARAGTIETAFPQIALPIVVQGQRIGQVRLRYDLGSVQRAAWTLTAALTLGLALLLAGAFVLARHLIDSRVLAPVRALLARVGPGGSTAPQPLSAQTPREVEELAQRIERLQRDIDAHVASLQRAHESHNEAMDRLCAVQRLASVGQLAAELAHEMNTPIANILGYARTAAAEADSEPLRRRLAVIERQAERLAASVREILGSVHPPNPAGQRFDLAKRVRDIAEVLAPVLRRHGVALDAHVPADRAEVWADPTLVEQIVFNLVSNAQQAGARTVRLSLQPRADACMLRVEDDGPGIDDAVRRRLFEAFVTTRERGTGLGLALSRRLARDMDGELELERSGADGTTFCLRLPVAAERLCSVAS